MAISREEVIYIAKLARLNLTEAEIGLYTRQLSDIIAYVEQLQELDVEDTEPMSHVLDLINVMREDKALPPLKRDEVLKNAASHDGMHFKVPRVIKES
jgi:aspartyl-tRNA(Asn)/glutamyl-tRNA(Gln) amidotransferase subunit C